MIEYYLWFKAFHIISVISWMAAMLYLPRLFVYHVETEKGSAQSETFKIMEKKLLRYIATPAMLSTWFFAVMMLVANPDLLSQGWFHAKLLLVIFLSGFHGMCAGWVKKFAKDINTKPQKFYRIVNEVPTFLLIIVVILAVVKPF
tara:strand:- start:995 stop:1429 length:435 start_codon:yes stop_codon:yes gene_type:complete